MKKAADILSTIILFAVFLHLMVFILRWFRRQPHWKRILIIVSFPAGTLLHLLWTAGADLEESIMIFGCFYWYWGMQIVWDYLDLKKCLA